MPGSAPQPPAALNLRRLSRVTPNLPVELPSSEVPSSKLASSAAKVLHLTKTRPGAAGGSVVCLEAELIIDFASGAFVHLRMGEACALPGAHCLLPAAGHCTVLLIGC